MHFWISFAFIIPANAPHEIRIKIKTLLQHVSVQIYHHQGLQFDDIRTNCQWYLYITKTKKCTVH